MKTLILLVALVLGCVGDRRELVGPIQVWDAVLLSPGMAQYTVGWEREAQKRFSEPLLVMGHGNDFLGSWCVWASVGGQEVPIPVEWMVGTVQEAHPGRTIVLIVCNPHGEKLKGSNVWYARRSVWLVPNLEAGRSDVRGDQNDVGSIWEFVESQP